MWPFNRKANERTTSEFPATAEQAPIVRPAAPDGAAAPSPSVTTDSTLLRPAVPESQAAPPPRRKTLRERIFGADHPGFDDTSPVKSPLQLVGSADEAHKAETSRKLPPLAPDDPLNTTDEFFMAPSVGDPGIRNVAPGPLLHEWIGDQRLTPAMQELPITPVYVTVANPTAEETGHKATILHVDSRPAPAWIEDMSRNVREEPGSPWSGKATVTVTTPPERIISGSDLWTEDTKPDLPEGVRVGNSTPVNISPLQHPPTDWFSAITPQSPPAASQTAGAPQHAADIARPPEPLAAQETFGSPPSREQQPPSIGTPLFDALVSTPPLAASMGQMPGLPPELEKELVASRRAPEPLFDAERYQQLTQAGEQLTMRITADEAREARKATPPLAYPPFPATGNPHASVGVTPSSWVEKTRSIPHPRDSRSQGPEVMAGKAGGRGGRE